MGAHKNRLGEAILMSTHNIGFHEEMTKIIFQLSSNTHLISFSAIPSIYKAFMFLAKTVFLLNK